MRKMNPNNNRRKFIKQSVAVSAGFVGFSQYLMHCSSPERKPLSADLSSNASDWLELPEGFTAKIISKWGDTMSDGFKVPGAHDGMAAFDVEGKVVLVRNHEVSPGADRHSPYGGDKELFAKMNKEDFFDYGFGKRPCVGGTTNIVFNEATQEMERDYLSLVGTIRNCAGGAYALGKLVVL